MGDIEVRNEKNDAISTEQKETDVEELLRQLDEEFKNRFTEEDEEYKKVWESDIPSPPIILNFGKTPDRNRDRRNRWYRNSSPYHRPDNDRYRTDRWD